MYNIKDLWGNIHMLNQNLLNQTKKDLTVQARRLVKPYEQYSIDELADAYCEAVDTNNAVQKDIYISALLLRFWYTIDKMFKANTVAPSLEHEDFFWWLYEAIEYACKYRGWKDPTKKLNAQQCINKCIETIKLQKYYNLRLDKYKAVNFCSSLETPLGGEGDDGKTIGDMLESTEFDPYGSEEVSWLVQSYINSNKIVEAILIDNIAFNDVQRQTRRTVKTQNSEGQVIKYTEYSSEFWPYRLVQIVSKLPTTYKNSFLRRYRIGEEKLSAALAVIDKANNQKIYHYLDKVLAELRLSYAK
jgi:hypothetical protein